jgi:hypothetical protein
MIRTLRTVALVALTATLTLAFTQERVKKKKLDFVASHSAALKAWNSRHYGACLEEVRAMTSAVSIQRMKAILAAIPAPPEGFEIRKQTEPEKVFEQAGAMAGMMGAIGTQVEVSMRGEGATLDYSIIADSPAAQMMGMMFSNPAVLGADAELIKYGAHRALLGKEGKRWSLKLLLNDKHVIEVKVTGRDDEFLLGIVNQAVVDKLAAALSN